MEGRGGEGRGDRGNGGEDGFLPRKTNSAFYSSVQTHGPRESTLNPKCVLQRCKKTHGPRESSLNPNLLDRPKEQIVRFTAL